MIIFMKPWLHKIEVFVDKIIPYLVLILLILIISDLFYHEKTSSYENEMLILDYFIVFVFIIDLSFKYYRVKNAKIFIKKYSRLYIFYDSIKKLKFLRKEVQKS